MHKTVSLLGLRARIKGGRTSKALLDLRSLDIVGETGKTKRVSNHCTLFTGPEKFSPTGKLVFPLVTASTRRRRRGVPPPSWSLPSRTPATWLVTTYKVHRLHSHWPYTTSVKCSHWGQKGVYPTDLLSSRTESFLTCHTSRVHSRRKYWLCKIQTFPRPNPLRRFFSWREFL